MHFCPACSLPGLARQREASGAALGKSRWPAMLKRPGHERELAGPAFLQESAEVAELCSVLPAGVNPGPAPHVRRVRAGVQGRPGVMKELLARDNLRIIQVLAHSLSAQARSDSALCLKRCISVATGDAATAEQLKQRLIDNACVESCVEVLATGGASCTSAVKQFSSIMVENIAALLHKLIQNEQAKQIAISCDCIQVLSKLIAGELKLAGEITLMAKASAAGCLCLLTVPQGFQTDLMDTISQFVRMQPPNGDKSASGSAQLSDEAMPETWSAFNFSTADLSNEDLENSAEAQNAIVDAVSKGLEVQVKLVADAGAIPALVKLCAGPAAPEGAGGKKPKKGKEPPLPPGMAEAQSSAAGCLRHLSLFDENRKAIVKAGGVPILAKLLESKTAQTRLHAQGTLLNLGADESSHAPMMAAKVPEHISTLSSPTKIADIAAQELAARAKEEAKLEGRSGKLEL
ncbi:hypothetical protein CYMTET_41643 [Cymbomonas tetramitiformis]|uniref:Uncharacterized protein n=1 Tax=Cymbomonas tetramitiformis TaxID=36881 RepID=A0AAE0C5Q0_9CHLO|nr:hypothetical protein CYMTET_41643 [Cymbomonas tetramitiformis]